MPKSILIPLIVLVIVLALGYIFWPSRSAAPAPREPLSTPTTLLPTTTPTPETPTLVEPVAEFKQRITKKPFGLYIDPQHSPVQPERFTGYHTGVDVEYGDVPQEVPVHAIAAGKIIHAATAQGYGGVVAIQHTINGQPVVAIYGHLKPASLPKAGQEVKAGDTIGRLGNGFTPETDGERKHLHFGLYKGSTLNLRGYVQNKSELAAWLDPATIF